MQPNPKTRKFTGFAGFLLSNEVRRSGGEYRTLKLFGQERNLITSGIARMNLFLHGVEDFQIIRGDTLADPKHIEGDRLRQFDAIRRIPSNNGIELPLSKINGAEIFSARRLKAVPTMLFSNTFWHPSPTAPLQV